ncbi:Rz1-like lysis system protein LysC [Hafnia alvei]|uniref:Rz1-like lysis system protein LysC n=1 Tax=Hafnia alvei TaxID=569 RepID=UPI00103A929E|nr:peptidase [Hafnia alvei]QBJ32918.1 peptidase [Hafnia alvei]
MMIALIVLFLLMQLSGCGNTRTVYVQAPIIPLPSNLTAETPKPKVPNSMSWSDSLLLKTRLYSALEQCNLDKAAIRKIELSRTSQ